MQTKLIFQEVRMDPKYIAHLLCEYAAPDGNSALFFTTERCALQQTVAKVLAAFLGISHITQDFVDAIAVGEARPSAELPRRRIAFTHEGLPTKRMRGTIAFTLLCDAPEVSGALEEFAHALKKALCSSCRYLQYEVDVQVIIESRTQRVGLHHRPEDEHV